MAGRRLARHGGEVLLCSKGPKWDHQVSKVGNDALNRCAFHWELLGNSGISFKCCPSKFWFQVRMQTLCGSYAMSLSRNSC